MDGSGATCNELTKIIAVDKKAVKFEKDKIEAMGSKAKPADVKMVAEAEKLVEEQLVNGTYETACPGGEEMTVPFARLVQGGRYHRTLRVP